MKIISGEFKGRILHYREKKGLRATSQKVKEALFGCIGGEIQGKKVLDLFCGYGSLGIEALSRGAESVVFVDRDSHTLKQVSLFARELNIQARIKTVRKDALKALQGCEPSSFDIILMDPPYHEGYEEKALAIIGDKGILTPGGICVVEHSAKNALPDISGTLNKIREKKYGDTALTFFTFHTGA